MWLNVLVAAFNKYGFGRYTYGTKAKLVVCNFLGINGNKWGRSPISL